VAEHAAPCRRSFAFSLGVRLKPQVTPQLESDFSQIDQAISRENLLEAACHKTKLSSWPDFRASKKHFPPASSLARRIQYLLYVFRRAQQRLTCIADLMIPNALAMLTKPTGHLVYPHTNAAHLAEAMGLFASAGLREGEAVILIMAASHCQPIRERLQKQGFDLHELETTGQLVCGKAEDLLLTFLFDGIIDEHRFKTIFDRMIENAKSFNDKRRSGAFSERWLTSFGSPTLELPNA